jgi:hypothetical protein
LSSIWARSRAESSKRHFKKNNDFVTRFGVMRFRFAEKWGLLR